MNILGGDYNVTFIMVGNRHDNLSSSQIEFLFSTNAFGNYMNPSLLPATMVNIRAD